MKHILTLAALVFATSCFGQVPDYVPADGLVGWFPCDSSLLDLTGTYTADEVAFDGFVEGAYGNVNGALGFDGESDFVRFNGNPGFEDFSIGLWVKTELEEHGPIVHVGRDDGTEYNGFSLGIGGESMNTPGNFLKAHFSGVGYFDVSSSVPYESWQHVCLTWGSQVLTFYVQGELVGTVSTASTFFTPSSKLYFAAFSETIYEKYGGAIDQIGLWNRVLSPAEVSQLFAWNTPVGCTEQLACNFDPDAALDDGSCHFNCQFCDDGTVWDEGVFKCVVANPSDTDFDGCVSMTDLLDLLSVFGTCPGEEPEEDPEMVEWSCGDPVGYHGYDYPTVLIGEQCWFAENLQATSYANGDPLSVADNIEDWVGSLDGMYETYGNPIWGCQNLEFAPFDVCNPDSSLHYFGRLYNWYAVNDSRGLCPAGWDVPSDSAFAALEVLLDVPEDEVFSLGWRGIQAGKRLKSNSTDHYPWNGSNTTGLSLVPSGTVNSGFDTPFGGAGYDVVLWTSTSYAVSPPYAWFRSFNSTYDSIHRNAFYRHLGASVRCIQDS